MTKPTEPTCGDCKHWEEAEPTRLQEWRTCWKESRYYGVDVTADEDATACPAFERKENDDA